MRFTTLLHHIHDADALREAYFGLKRGADHGVDGVTWGHDGENLEENFRDLSDRLKRRTNRPKPTRRTSSQSLMVLKGRWA